MLRCAVCCVTLHMRAMCWCVICCAPRVAQGVRDCGNFELLSSTRPPARPSTYIHHTTPHRRPNRVALLPPCVLFAGLKLVREATEAAEARKEKDKEAGGCTLGERG